MSSKLQWRELKVLPRKDIVAKCLAHSYILLAKTYKEAFDLSNQYAPEHLIYKSMMHHRMFLI